MVRIHNAVKPRSPCASSYKKELETTGKTVCVPGNMLYKMEPKQNQIKELIYIHSSDIYISIFLEDSFLAIQSP